MGVSINQLDEAIKKELKLYSKDVTEKINKSAYETTKILVNTTKTTAPVGNRKKHYRDSITMKKLATTSSGSVSYLWYVKGSDYRLSHLLNNGHALHYGGRVAGTHFITKAEETAVKEFEESVKNIVSGG